MTIDAAAQGASSPSSRAIQDASSPRSAAVPLGGQARRAPKRKPAPASTSKGKKRLTRASAAKTSSELSTPAPSGPAAGSPAAAAANSGVAGNGASSCAPARLTNSPPGEVLSDPASWMSNTGTSKAATSAAAQLPVPSSMLLTGNGPEPRPVHREPFNLSEFMASYQPISSATAASDVPTTALDPTPMLAHAAAPATTVADRAPTAILDELNALKDEVRRLRQQVADSPSSQCAATTAPNARREMPANSVCHLSSGSFPMEAKRAKGDYQPPQAHLLAAGRMFKEFSDGKSVSPMSFVLRLREAQCVSLRAPPAVLMAVFSGRLGARGLTVLHFRAESEADLLEAGSSNSNFSSDFSPAASLPRADTRSYNEISDGLHGLAVMGQQLWYPHILPLVEQLQSFVSQNK
ncbi:Serine/threonine-protein kinase Nek2 [Phytophthora cinnamomi]|uniref:Serine/threonine-protein kinase Nek2 n=1 Tax=Phytophthora cinnamomi TaxID=4785 RepID=UPI003559AF9D|nr:Serine/threonine-protein kinase Nek2 [Phytophthora cinnamomi]